MERKDNRSDDQLLTIIWNYLVIEQPLQTADVIIVGGSHDVEVAHYATELYGMNFAPLIVFSGQQHDSDMSAADYMSKTAREYGVPEAAILKEQHSKNSSQTITLSQTLLAENGVTPKVIILVNAPYMMRSFLAAAEAQWTGEMPIFVSRHQPVSLPEYSMRYGRGETIRNILGNFQRLRPYAKKGYQTTQIIPDDVQVAYDALIWRGHKTR